MTFVERGFGRQFTGVAGHMIAFVHIFVTNGDLHLMESCSYYHVYALYMISGKLAKGASLYVL